MLRRIKVGLLLGAAILVAGAMATSAAYVTVDIERPATAQLTGDDAANAAVRILCLDNTQGGTVTDAANYLPLCTYSSGGSVSIALDKALEQTRLQAMFNRDATFTVGGSAAGNRVISITNNSRDPLTVYFENTSTVGSSITMYSQSGTALPAAGAGTGDAIPAGGTREYYFGLSIADDAGAALNGNIQIR